MAFRLNFPFNALGNSFRSASRQLHVIREESGIAAFDGAFDASV